MSTPARGDASDPLDDRTRIVARGADPSPAADEPDDGTLLVQRPATDAAPEEPDDGTLLVQRPATSPAPEDRTRVVPRPAGAPVPQEPEDGTLLVRRPAADAEPTVAPDDSTRHTRRPADPLPAADPAVAVEPAPDDATRLTRRPAPPEDRTLLTRRPAADPVPESGRDPDAVAADSADDDDTRLGARATADADAERTRLAVRRGPRDAPADGTALSPRSRRSARTRAAKAKAAAEALPALPPEPVDERPVTERYAIRTRQVDAAPAVAAVPSAAVTTGDGGLSARTARRRALRTRLTVLFSTAAVLTVGSIVGLVLLIAA
jgi:hypothetical protein